MSVALPKNQTLGDLPKYKTLLTLWEINNFDTYLHHLFAKLHPEKAIRQLYVGCNRTTTMCGQQLLLLSLWCGPHTTQ